MTLIQSFDPGNATGVALGHFDDETPYTLDSVITVPNAVEGLAELFWDAVARDEDFYAADPHILLVENYIMDHGPQDPVALEVIGFIKGTRPLDTDIVFRKRSDKKLCPDKVLKDHDLWQTGKMVNWTDGRDANDAIIHAIGYVAFALRHGPTLSHYYGV